jgi:ubiquinone/menaquinone biosynthesis C-methylase UbiE
VSSENLYNQTNIQTMEMVYGRGYLSAGGDKEVEKILSVVDAQDKHVLDLGCGLGGAAVAMVRNLGVAKVTGFDIDAVVLERAAVLIDEYALGDKIELISGQPGPLPFEIDQFDIVYMTAVSCHINDLEPFLIELCRVLKPGGWLLGSEWIQREDNEAYRVWDNLLRQRGLNFYFKNSQTFVESLEHCGLRQVSLNDRTDSFAKFSSQARQRVVNELRTELEATLGNEGYKAFLDWADVRYRSMRDGGMLQCHFSGQKPV